MIEEENNSEAYSFEDFKDAVQDPYSTDVRGVAKKFKPENYEQRLFKAMVLEEECLFEEAESEYEKILEEVNDHDKEIEFMASYRMKRLPKE